MSMSREEFHEQERLKRGAKYLASQINLQRAMIKNGFADSLHHLDLIKLRDDLQAMLKHIQELEAAKKEPQFKPAKGAQG